VIVGGGEGDGLTPTGVAIGCVPQPANPIKTPITRKNITQSVIELIMGAVFFSIVCVTRHYKAMISAP
jgi:hypothetical protein